MAMSLRSHSLVLRAAGGGGCGVLQARRQLGPHHQHRYLMKAMKDFFTRRSTANSEPPPKQQSPLPRTPVSASGWVRASAPGFRSGPRDPLSGRLRGQETHFIRNDGLAIAHRFIDVMHTFSEQLDTATIPAGELFREATLEAHGDGKQSPGDRSAHLKRLEDLKGWQNPMLEARSHLLSYYRLLNLNETDVGYDHKSIEKAKAILAADDAGRRVFIWIRSSGFREVFETPSYSFPGARDVLILAIEIIVGAGHWRRLQGWLHGSARAYNEHDIKAAFRLQIRRDLLEGTLEAIYRWDPRGAVSGDACKFLAMCVDSPHRYIDMAPLVSRALEKSCRRDARGAAVLDKSLLTWKHELLDLRGAIELQAAIMDLYHQVPPSRWNLKTLLADIKYDNFHPLRPENNRWMKDLPTRMHWSASAYAELVGHQHDIRQQARGLHPRFARTGAEKVLQRVKDVYGDGSSSSSSARPINYGMPSARRAAMRMRKE